jgi:hypothetical protein
MHTLLQKFVVGWNTPKRAVYEYQPCCINYVKSFAIGATFHFRHLRFAAYLMGG